MSTQNNYSIILVHLGEKFPQHLYDCIKQIRIFNKKCDIYVLINCKCNNITKLYENVSQYDVNIYNTKDIQKSTDHEYFDKNYASFTHEFRDNYWKYTSQRFFVMDDFCKQKNINNFFHMENDNLLYVNLEDYNDIISDLYKIGAPFDKPGRVVPGFMYFKTHDDLTQMCHFMAKYSSVKDEQDMMIIGRYFELFPDKINHFPVLWHRNDLQRTNFDKLNALVDGSVAGMFIGGTDPRNITTTPFVPALCPFANYNAYDLHLQWDLQNELFVPVSIMADKKIPIINLHIHSKDLK